MTDTPAALDAQELACRRRGDPQCLLAVDAEAVADRAPGQPGEDPTIAQPALGVDIELDDFGRCALAHEQQLAGGIDRHTVRAPQFLGRRNHVPVGFDANQRGSAWRFGFVVEAEITHPRAPIAIDDHVVQLDARNRRSAAVTAQHAVCVAPDFVLFHLHDQQAAIGQPA